MMELLLGFPQGNLTTGSPGSPIGTIVCFAGQLSSSDSGANVAWPASEAGTQNSCCASNRTTVQGSPSSSAPVFGVLDDWMLCDGRQLPISQYSALFAVLGHIYDGQPKDNMFTIPDCRGLFIRGVDAGSGMDPDVDQRRSAAGQKGSKDGVGSLQCDAFQTHTHESVESARAQVAQEGEPITGVIGGNTGEPTASDTTRISSETRPRNIAMNYIIKYK